LCNRLLTQQPLCYRELCLGPAKKFCKNVASSKQNTDNCSMLYRRFFFGMTRLESPSTMKLLTNTILRLAPSCHAYILASPQPTCFSLCMKNFVAGSDQIRLVQPNGTLRSPTKFGSYGGRTDPVIECNRLFSSNMPSDSYRTSRQRFATLRGESSAPTRRQPRPRGPRPGSSQPKPTRCDARRPTVLRRGGGSRPRRRWLR